MKLVALIFIAGFSILLVAAAVNAQNATAADPTAASGSSNLAWQCPMDHDVRSSQPGICSRCGMKLVAGIPEPVEFPVDFSVVPRLLRPGADAQLQFVIHDPDNGREIKRFEIVHEKLFHLFVISQDLEYFVHDHPVFGEDATFRYGIKFPRSGLYRILTDFYPEGATPQLTAKTVIVPGQPQPVPALKRDYATKQTENLHVSLTTDPPQPIAGMKTMLLFHLDPDAGIEKYIGAWGHMLVASSDLIDLIHTHPFIANGGPDMQFNVYFPRPMVYRIWVQFQRNGMVNTARFDVPVRDLD